MLKPSLVAQTDAKADEAQIRIFDDVRITYLTSKLIRVEKGDSFTDLASNTVWYRRFPTEEFTAEKRGNKITVETKDTVFVIKGGVPYSATLKDSGKTEIFSKQVNLKGTRRTLDRTYGKASLEDGLITEGGVYLLDDSKTVLLGEDGMFTSRNGKSKDYYAFAYGKNPRETVRAFYQISGSVPLVPRFALGVWWSRYHAYTQKEYLDLMQRFSQEEIPLTVATVDMDWHWVHNINEKFGVKYGGWTGYSWNSELFPDYKEFLRELKNRNLHITLNLHPADGVHCYEDMYGEMAKAMGVDPETKQKIDFRCSSSDFWNAYFDILHKPYEKDGVDFWWIDWQQGKRSDIKGLDPLKALNHYHYLDNAENGQMPMTLSRYGGLGSHRYPLGFSGDTAMSWDVLNFQPYFTANATNAAYTWWSHDIGGHHEGYRDDDLYIRWIEFGVFSPIMRLHSTAIELLGKEPWKYRSEVYKSAKDWLRFRHRLIPYIFSMNHRTHSQSLALCEPMYYEYPDCEKAYECPNEYKFGSELIACPITKPQYKTLNMGSVNVWLPKGRWTDIATGQSYAGENRLELFRELDTIPLLAKEGAIIPLSGDEGNSVDNPKALTLLVVSGNGEFELTEDNGKTDFDSHKAITKFAVSYCNEELTVKIFKARGDTSVIPETRKIRACVRDIEVDGEPLVIDFGEISIYEDYEITVSNAVRKHKEPLRDAVINIMSRWQTTTKVKAKAYKIFEGLTDEEDIVKAFNTQAYSAGIPREIRAAIKEKISEE